jgi:hypothetical protein
MFSLRLLWFAAGNQALRVVIESISQRKSYAHAVPGLQFIGGRDRKINPAESPNGPPARCDQFPTTTKPSPEVMAQVRRKWGACFLDNEGDLNSKSGPS